MCAGCSVLAAPRSQDLSEVLSPTASCGVPGHRAAPSVSGLALRGVLRCWSRLASWAGAVLLPVDNPQGLLATGCL